MGLLDFSSPDMTGVNDRNDYVDRRTKWNWFDFLGSGVPNSLQANREFDLLEQKRAQLAQQKAISDGAQDLYRQMNTPPTLSPRVAEPGLMQLEADTGAKAPSFAPDWSPPSENEQYRALAKLYAFHGDPTTADKIMETLNKSRPKTKADNYVGRDQSGNLTQYMIDDSGGVTPSPYAPAQKVTWQQTMGKTGPVMTPMGEYGSVGSGGPAAVQDAPEGFQYGPDGQLRAVDDYWNRKMQVANAGKTNIALNVPINTEKTYWGNVAEGLAKEFSDQRSNAQKAVDQIETSKRVLGLLDQGPITGAGANWRLPLEKGLAQIGVVNGNRVATTEQLAGQLAKSTLDGIKSSGLGSGQGFTDKDRDFLEKAVSGNITLEPQTLRYLATLNDKAGRAAIAKYQKSASNLEGNRNQQVLPVDLNIEAPPPYVSPTNVQQVGSAQPFGKSFIYVGGKPLKVLRVNPDGSKVVQDPKTGRTGTYRE